MPGTRTVQPNDATIKYLIASQSHVEEYQNLIKKSSGDPVLLKRIYNAAVELIHDNGRYLSKHPNDVSHMETLVKAYECLKSLGKTENQLVRKDRSTIRKWFSEHFGTIRTYNNAIRMAEHRMSKNFDSYLEVDTAIKTVPVTIEETLKKHASHIEFALDAFGIKETKEKWESIKHNIIHGEFPTADLEWTQILENIVSAYPSHMHTVTDVENFLLGNTSVKNLIKTPDPFFAKVSARYADLERMSHKSPALERLWMKIQVGFLKGTHDAKNHKNIENYIKNFLKDNKNPKTLRADIYKLFFEKLPETDVDIFLFKGKSTEEILGFLTFENGHFFEKLEKLAKLVAPKFHSTSHSTPENKLNLQTIALDNRTYIASAAPRKDSVDEYFDALEADDTHIIVDLKNDYEQEMEGFKLLPEKKGATKTYGDTTLKLVENKQYDINGHPFATFNIATIEVTRKGITKQYEIFKLNHYFAEDTPLAAYALREFDRHVRVGMRSFGNKLAVHCANGMARTNAYLMYHHLAGPPPIPAPKVETERPTSSTLEKIDPVKTYLEYRRQRNAETTPKHLAAVIGALNGEMAPTALSKKEKKEQKAKVREQIAQVIDKAPHALLQKGYLKGNPELVEEVKAQFRITEDVDKKKDGLKGVLKKIEGINDFLIEQKAAFQRAPHIEENAIDTIIPTLERAFPNTDFKKMLETASTPVEKINILIRFVDTKVDDLQKEIEKIPTAEEQVSQKRMESLLKSALEDLSPAEQQVFLLKIKQLKPDDLNFLFILMLKVDDFNDVINEANAKGKSLLGLIANKDKTAFYKFMDKFGLDQAEFEDYSPLSVFIDPDENTKASPQQYFRSTAAALDSIQKSLGSWSVKRYQESLNSELMKYKSQVLAEMNKGGSLAFLNDWTKSEIQYLGVDLVKTLSPEQLGNLPAEVFKHFNKEMITNLSSDQCQWLDTEPYKILFQTSLEDKPPFVNLLPPFFLQNLPSGQLHIDILKMLRPSQLLAWCKTHSIVIKENAWTLYEAVQSYKPENKEESKAKEELSRYFYTYRLFLDKSWENSLHHLTDLFLNVDIKSLEIFDTIPLFHPTIEQYLSLIRDSLESDKPQFPPFAGNALFTYPHPLLQLDGTEGFTFSSALTQMKEKLKNHTPNEIDLDIIKKNFLLAKELHKKYPRSVDAQQAYLILQDLVQSIQRKARVPDKIEVSSVLEVTDSYLKAIEDTENFLNVRDTTQQKLNIRTRLLIQQLDVLIRNKESKKLTPSQKESLSRLVEKASQLTKQYPLNAELEILSQRLSKLLPRKKGTTQEEILRQQGKVADSKVQLEELQKQRRPSRADQDRKVRLEESLARRMGKLRKLYAEKNRVLGSRIQTIDKTIKESFSMAGFFKKKTGMAHFPTIMTSYKEAIEAYLALPKENKIPQDLLTHGFVDYKVPLDPNAELSIADGIYKIGKILSDPSEAIPITPKAYKDILQLYNEFLELKNKHPGNKDIQFGLEQLQRVRDKIYVRALSALKNEEENKDKAKEWRSVLGGKA